MCTGALGNGLNRGPTDTVNQLYLAAIKFGVWAKVDLFGAL